MANNYGVSSTVTSFQWRKKYKSYRACRTRLYLCMISLMLFVSLSVVCAAFLFKNSFYLNPSEYELNKGDMRAVDVSTLFCESIVVKKANFNRRITVVSSVKRYKTTKQSISSDIFVRRDRYWFTSFYLLKGSTVMMRLSSPHSVSVYWLKGRSTLDKWTKKMSEVLRQSFGVQTEKFTGTSMYDTFTVADDNNYYLGFASTVGNTEYFEVLVNLSVSRVIYDTSSYTAFCNASTGKSCHVQLRFNSHDTAVIAVDDTTTNIPTHDVWTIWYCEPRIWIYASVFGGGFLFGNVVLALVYVCVMSKVNKKSPEQKRSQIPTRTESFNMRAVKLQSISARDSTYNVCESSPRLTPRSTQNNQSDENKSEEHHDHECSVENGSITAVVTFSNDKNPEVNSNPWRTTPSPRWSTFLQDPAEEHEECITSFNQSPTGTLDLTSNQTPDNSLEEKQTSFENELAQHLKRLESNNIVYMGPEETDIDDPGDYTDSELEPFINENNINIENASQVGQHEVVKRREGRREQRWEPRLSMVTEV